MQTLFHRSYIIQQKTEKFGKTTPFFSWSLVQHPLAAEICIHLDTFLLLAHLLINGTGGFGDGTAKAVKELKGYLRIQVDHSFLFLILAEEYRLMEF